MPRTELAIETAPGVQPIAAEVLTWEAADVANGNAFNHTGNELLLARNVGAGSHNITFQTIAIGGRQDPSHNVAIPLAAGAYAVFGPFDSAGIRQDDDLVYVSADHLEVEFCPIRF